MDLKLAELLSLLLCWALVTLTTLIPATHSSSLASRRLAPHKHKVLPTDEELSIHLPEWQDSGRKTRGTDFRKTAGIRIGDNKFGESKQHCPRGIAPCQCKEKTSGIDVTCEKINLDELIAVTDNLKAHNRNTNVGYTISYFKIRECKIPKFPDYIFMGLKISHLYIYNCEVQTLMPNSLSSLAATLKHLVLSGNRLLEVPKMALRQLRELDHLNLNQNNITKIREGSFWGLGKLTRLTIYQNAISQIDAGAFDGLTKLTEAPENSVKGDLLRLNVGRNHLSEIPKDAITTLKNLNQLEMSENKITTITPGVFRGLERLDTLTLNHNLLHNLNSSGFDGLYKLTSLSLDYNKISEIHEEAFRGLEEGLQSLSMTNNKLTAIPSPALRPLHQLTTLHLDDNNITRLEDDEFQGFGEHIKNLWLQNNHISLIPATAFNDLHSLEWLKLFNNELTSLHFELMEPILDTLKNIDIHSNPLVCDCEMRWYKKWYENEWQEIDKDYIKETSCIDPVDHHEHKITEVDLNHMYCLTPVIEDEDGGAGHLSVHVLLVLVSIAVSWCSL